MKKIQGTLVCALMVGALASWERDVRAEPRTHDGFQFRGTAGLGYLGDSESLGGLSDNIHGVAGTSEFFFGGTLADGFSLGGYLGFTVAPGPSVSYGNGQRSVASSDVNLNFFTIGPYVDYYLDPHEGLHFLATVGFADLNVSNGGSSSDAATGFGIGAGVGYDWWVSDNWSLGVLGRFQYAHMTLNGASENAISPTVAFSFNYQ